MLAARDGITINGGCNHVVERNEVSQSYVGDLPPGAPFGIGFKAAHCAGTTWRDNLAVDNEGSGYGISAHWSGDLVFEDNWPAL